MTTDGTTVNTPGFDGPPVWLDDRGDFGKVVVIRASAMGMCTRAMVARFQGFDAMQPPEQMQQRFDDGHLHESSTLRKMETKENVTIEAHSGTVRLVIIPGKLEIHGHVDGVVVNQDGEGYAVAEAKAFSDGMFKQYLSKGGPGELYGYGMQAVIYMLAMGFDTILYGVKNKNSGEVDARWFDVTDPSLPKRSDIISRAMAIFRAVTDQEAAVGTMTCDKVMFPCPVFYLHEETVKPELEDTVLKQMLVEYKAVQVIESKAKEEKDRVGLLINERLKLIGQDSISIEGWSVTGKVGNTTQYDWDEIERLTGKKKADFGKLKPNSKASLTVTAPKGWVLGQGELGD